MNRIPKYVSNSDYRKLIWVTLFAIAMGMMESAVVIYLRELYYPEGFQFPIRATSTTVAVTELLRELATIIMLLGVGRIAGKNRHERFAWFIFSFAIWDIFYYIFLYLIIGWPASLAEWDVLFLLPMIWVGPVWAPLCLSLLMILLARCILHFSDKRKNSDLKPIEWFVLTGGSLTVIIAFCKEYYQFMTSHHPTISITQLFYSKQTISYTTQYIPGNFDVMTFILGCTVICAGIGIYIIRNKRQVQQFHYKFKQ